MTGIKGIPIKEAIKLWEQANSQPIGEAQVVSLIGHLPAIDKLDASMNSLANCEKLSLSTNMIEKLTNLNGLKSLKILSLGRNHIKSLSGIEAVADTLEQLWISYNLIDKLKGVGALKVLKVLYMAHNAVKEWPEFVKLAEVSHLQELVFVGNPLEDRMTSDGIWRDKVIAALPPLRKLDGFPVIRPE